MRRSKNGWPISFNNPDEPVKNRDRQYGLTLGVLFATVITLLLAPAGYMILDDIHRGIDQLKGRA